MATQRFIVDLSNFKVLASVLKEFGWAWASGEDLTTHIPSHLNAFQVFEIFVWNNLYGQTRVKEVTWNGIRGKHCVEQLTRNMIMSRLGLFDVNEVI